MQRLIAVLIAAVLMGTLLAVLGAVAGPFTGGAVSVARAAEQDVAERGRPYSITGTKTGPDPLCEKARDHADQPGDCRAKAALFETVPYRRDTSRLARGNELWCADWKMYMRGLYYINWKEEMRGSFCWIEGPAAPSISRRAHRCGYGHAYGVTIDINYCEQDKRFGDTTYGWWWSAYDHFSVTALVRGFPIRHTYEMWVNQHPTGNVTFKPSSDPGTPGGGGGSWRLGAAMT
ncbi:hypothetical protein [Nocardioides pelophilus]|uniref:hypothetical protein n=1 Tax=Nocardioides pelophilus TaxID=2172019 RepID=UPI001602493A|nr:hypothetical protein [Nocardioides pelophilus]